MRRREKARRISALIADHLGDAVSIHLVEDQPEAQDELSPKRRLEHCLGGVALPVERLAVERGAATVGSFGDVEDGPVEMDAGVAEAARSMQEDRSEEALARLDDCAGMSSTDEAGGRFEVALDLVSGGVERFLDLSCVVVGAECPDQGHGLRRRQREVEADHVDVVLGHPEAVG